MLSCLFAIVIHGLLLLIGVSFALVVYGKPVWGLPPDRAAVLLSIVVMGALLLLSLTPVGAWILRWQMGCRRPTPQESEFLWPAWQSVCLAAGYNPASFRLYVIDGPVNNAFAIGSNTIAVTVACLYGTSDRELRGVLAHELGHHVNNDTLWMAMTATAEHIGISVYNFIAFLSRIVGVLAIIPLVGFVAALITIIIKLILTVFDFVVLGAWRLGYFWGSRQNEYAADRYAAQIGFADGLASYLDKYGDKQAGWFAWIEALKSTHPGAGERVKKLRKYSREALRNA